MNETNEDIEKSAEILKNVFNALIPHYAKAAKEGKLQRWANAAHSVIDLWAGPIKDPWIRESAAREIESK